MLYTHMLNGRALPEPPRNNKKFYISELGDQSFITNYVTYSLDQLKLEKLCDSSGKFPKSVIVDFYGSVKGSEASRSKMPSTDFKTYLMQHFDLSNLSLEQKSWVEEAIKTKLKSISDAAKKAEKQRIAEEKKKQRELEKTNGTRPVIKRRYLKKRFSEMTDEERRQARFERVQKMYENSVKREQERKERNNPDNVM